MPRTSSTREPTGDGARPRTDQISLGRLQTIPRQHEVSAVAETPRRGTGRARASANADAATVVHVPKKGSRKAVDEDRARIAQAAPRSPGRAPHRRRHRGGIFGERWCDTRHADAADDLSAAINRDRRQDSPGPMRRRWSVRVSKTSTLPVLMPDRRQRRAWRRRESGRRARIHWYLPGCTRAAAFRRRFRRCRRSISGAGTAH